MKKEVYRSFEGKLDAENQGGYVISELNDFYEVEFFNVWGKTSRVRIKKAVISEKDFEDLDKIAELTMDIEHGRIDAGQCYWHGKWYGYDLIRNIQKKNQDYEWKRYV